MTGLDYRVLIWVPGLQGQVRTVMLPLMSSLMGVNTGEPRDRKSVV